MPVGRWNGEAWGAVLRMSANPDEPDRVSPRWCGEAESNRRAGHGSEPARDLPPRVVFPCLGSCFPPGLPP